MEMAAEKSEEDPLRELLGKINHALPDVRSRGMRSVLFKLSSGLLSPSELVHERQFLVHLLEWFNFEEWPLEGQVLGLLAQLAEHEPAASTLVEIGAVQFLSQLRVHSDPSLHVTVDTVLEHLLKLPQASTNSPTSAASQRLVHHHYPTGTPPHSRDESPHFPQQSQGSSQQTFSTDYTSDVGSYQSSKASLWEVNSPSSAPASLPQQYLDKTLSPGTASSQSCVVMSSSSSGTSPWVEAARQVPDFPYTASTVAPPHPPPSHPEPQQQDTWKERSGAIFPWLRLTANDRHILAVTENRLQDSSADAMQQSCEFIQEVLFQDFPPQLFLQRPSIVTALLRLLTQEHSGGGGGGREVAVLQCLLLLTARLKRRVGLLADPALQLMPEALSFPNVDSKMQSSLSDHDFISLSHDQVSGSHDLEQLSHDMLRQLQSQQLLPRHYCSAVLDSVTPLLPSFLGRDFLLSQPGSEGRLLLQCVSSCLQIIAACVELRQGIAKHCTPVDEQCAPESGGVVVVVCSVLCHSVAKWRRLASQPTSSQTQLSSAAWVTAHLTHCLACALDTSDTWVSDPKLSPTVSSVLSSVMMSGALAVVHPHLQDRLLPHYDRLDAANCRVLKKVWEFGNAFKKMADFLRPSTESHDHMIAVATAALPGLWFHCNREFVTKAVTACLHRLLGSAMEDGHWAPAKELLLKLLAFGSGEVKRLAYSTLEEQVLKSLSELGAEPSQSASPAPPSSSSSGVITLLLNRDVLAELCCHGAVCECGEASSSACQVLAALLKHVLETKHLHSQLRGAFTQWLPYIEACLCSHDGLCRVYQQLLCSEWALPELVQLHSHFRLLYTGNTELRGWAFTHLTRLLIAERLKLDPFSRKVSLLHHDVLIMGTSAPKLHYTARSDKTFTVEDVVKLLHILKSPAMDTALKKTALEQLVLLLKDCQLYGPALEQGVSTEVLNLLKMALTIPDTGNNGSSSSSSSSSSSQEGPPATARCSNEEALLRPCFQCLQLLAGCSAELRRELASDSTLLLDILRGALLQCCDGELLHSASALLGSLLFCSVSTFSQEEGMSIPRPLLQRLKFPCTVSAIDVKNCHTTPSPLELSLVTSEPLLSMLRLHYHVALNGDMETVIARREDLSSLEDEKLRLQQCDVRSMKSLHWGLTLADCCNELQEASSHCKVLDALSHLELLLSSHQSWGFNENMDWQQLTQRFLNVQPSTAHDMELLGSVLRCLTVLLEPRPPSLGSAPPTLAWLAEATAARGSVCLQLLQASLEQGKQRDECHALRSLQKMLLKFYTALVLSVVSLSASSSPPHEVVFDPLALLHVLCQCLDAASAPYNLPLLEASLECLLHLSASGLIKGTLIAERTSLSVKLLTSLRQVLWSFMSGRAGMLASFMGKGVSSKAALSMAHLLHAIADLKPPESWWLQWLQSSDVGLSWLRLLVQDRQQTVRYAGLSIVASLCSKPSVLEVLGEEWSLLSPFGLWGVCMQAAMDCGLCPLVRQQAFYVLVSVSAVCSQQNCWDQHLLCSTEELTLKGSKALEVFLTNYDMFELLKEQHTEITQAKESFATFLEKNFTQQTSHKSQQSVSQTLTSLALGSSQNSNSEMSLPDVDPGLLDFLQGSVDSFNPHVISGACKLLYNLTLAFPELVAAHMHSHSTVAALITALDNEMLAAIMLYANQRSPHGGVLSGWLAMMADAAHLLRVALSLRPDAVLPLLLKKEVLSALCGTLALLQQSGRSGSYGCLCVCSAVVSLLQTVVDTSDTHGCELLFSAVQLEWNSFSHLLLHSLTSVPSPAPPSLRPPCLRLFCSVLAHSFQPHSQVTTPHTAGCCTPHSALRELLDTEKKNKAATDSKDPSPVGGSELCSALLTVYDSSPVSGGVTTKEQQQHQLVGSALASLLAASTTAKHTALKAGLLESCVEHLKTLHSNLCMEVLEHGSRKKNDAPLLNDLIATMSLLRNFLYKSSEVKSAALGCHLPAVLHRLWPSCTVSKRLCIAVLRLLSTLTAQHQAGRASLASSSSRGAPCLLQSVLKHTSHCLAAGHDSCLTAARLAGLHTELLAASFPLLANCALSSECRAVLKKTGFVAGFARVQPKSEKSTKTRLSSLWLKLLVTLSFSSEGQQMIIKQPGSVDVLLDVYCWGGSESKKHSLSVLRNLCFYGPSKTLLASNGDFQKVLAAALESGDSSLVALAASAVWALLHNCTKVRQSLNKARLCEKVLQIHASMQSPELKLSKRSTPHGDAVNCENTLAKVVSVLQ